MTVGGPWPKCIKETFTFILFWKFIGLTPLTQSSSPACRPIETVNLIGPLSNFNTRVSTRIEKHLPELDVPQQQSPLLEPTSKMSSRFSTLARNGSSVSSSSTGYVQLTFCPENTCLTFAVKLRCPFLKQPPSLTLPRLYAPSLAVGNKPLRANRHGYFRSRGSSFDKRADGVAHSACSRCARNTGVLARGKQRGSDVCWVEEKIAHLACVQVMPGLQGGFKLEKSCALHSSFAWLAEYRTRSGTLGHSFGPEALVGDTEKFVKY